METVYIDSLFALNLVVDYFLLLAASFLSSRKPVRWRLALAAAAGAGYCCLTVLPGFMFLTAAPVKIACAALMVLIAFGGSRRYLRTLIIFLAVSALFGGAVYMASMLGGLPRGDMLYVPVSMRVLALSFAVCYAAITIVFRRLGTRPERAVAEVRIGLFDRAVTVNALRDTGNSLRDPVSGRAVLVAELSGLLPLFPTGLRARLKAAKSFEDVLAAFEGVPGFTERFRLIPYSAVGVKSSLLPAFRPDSVTVGGNPEEGVLVALSHTALCEDGEYTAVL